MEAVNGIIEAGHLVGLIGWLVLAGPNSEVRWVGQVTEPVSYESSPGCLGTTITNIV